MTSAFDGFSQEASKSICSALWAGQSMASIAKDWEVPRKTIAAMRDELFAAYSDPQAVCDAANGPLINAQQINRPKAKRAPRRSGGRQIEMFSRC